MSLRVPIVSAAIMVLASASALYAEPTDPIHSSFTVTKGTPIRVRLETDLRSGRDKSGQVVLFTVDQNIYGPNHQLLLQKGAVAHGHVAVSEGHGSFGRSGKLTFTCDYAIADDGTRIPLDLSVTPGSKDRSVGEVGAEYHSSSREYYPYPSAEGYGDRQAGDFPDGYYQPSGIGASVNVDPGRVFGKGADVTADQGHEYEATVKNSVLLAAVPSSEQLFTLKDRSQIAGVLAGFDGKTYTLATSAGRRSIPAADVQSIQAVAPLPAP